MKKYIIIFLVGLTFRSYSQSGIKYFVPDTVEILLEKQVRSFKNNIKDEKVYFLLGKENDNTYHLSLIRDKSNQIDNMTAKLLKSNNRCIVIDQEQYPLIFDYDFTFGTPKETQIGEFGKREGNIVRSNMLFHGYSIYFNMKGQVLKVSKY